MRMLLTAALLMCFSLASWADSAAEQVSVEDATVRMPIPGRNVTSAYFLLRNADSQAHELVGVEVEFAARAEIHSHSMEEGMMRMRKEESVTIPAEGHLRFSSGGYHVMIFDLDSRPRTGDPLEMVLEFADGSKKNVSASAVSVHDRPHH